MSSTKRFVGLDFVHFWTFTDGVCYQAEKMLRECFPKKVVELNSLLHVCSK